MCSNAGCAFLLPFFLSFLFSYPGLGTTTVPRCTYRHAALCFFSFFLSFFQILPHQTTCHMPKIFGVRKVPLPYVPYIQTRLTQLHTPPIHTSLTTRTCMRANPFHLPRSPSSLSLPLSPSSKDKSRRGCANMTLLLCQYSEKEPPLMSKHVVYYVNFLSLATNLSWQLPPLTPHTHPPVR